MDLAISGEGLFTIAKGDELVFTRDGHFTRGSDGLLTTSSGLPVMGKNGFIDLGADIERQGNIKINTSGEIFVDDEAKKILSEADTLIKKRKLPP